MNTETINTPTAASLLIDALHPKHRALLHEALTVYLSETEISLDGHLNRKDNMQPATARRITEFHKWTIKEVREVKNILFAECFHDDMNLIPHFTKDLPPLPTEKKSGVS